MIEVGYSDNEADLEVGAVNYQRKTGRQQEAGNRGGAGEAYRKPGGPPLECYYCHKPAHFKRDCITRNNDRNKGVFRTSVNAPQSKRQNASLEVSEAKAAAAMAVNNAQLDIADYLNIHSA